MTAMHGKDGVVKVGSHAVAEIETWSITETAKVADSTKMGDTWESHIPGKTINAWSGSMTCHWDPSDTLGQEALTVGASVSLVLFPSGVATGATERTGTATITSVGVAVPKDNVVTRTFAFQGNGVLAQSVAP